MLTSEFYSNKSKLWDMKLTFRQNTFDSWNTFFPLNENNNGKSVCTFEASNVFV